MATRCLVGDAFPQVIIGNVTLRTTGNPELRFVPETGVYSLENPDEVSTQISINYSLREQVSNLAHRWYQDPEVLNFLRIRVITCLGEKNPTGLDFVSQRFNEYSNLSSSLETGEEIVGTSLYVQNVYESLVNQVQSINGQQYDLNNGQHLMRSPSNRGGSLYRPYDSQDPSVFIPNGIRGYDDTLDPRAEVLNDIVLFDQPLSNLIPRDENGEIRRRQITNVVPSDESSDLDTLVFEEVYLPSIEMIIGPDTDVGHRNNNIEHLSLYAFVYLDYDAFLQNYNFEPDNNILHTTLITGTGRATSATLIGDHYIYEDLTIETSRFPQRVLLEVVDSPDRIILQDLRFSNFPDYSVNLFNLHDHVFTDVNGSSLARNSTGKTIQKDDCFSDLWITKDIDENARYMFSFNLNNFLIERSSFPRLYSNEEVAKILLEGFEFNGITYKSEVKNINVSREYVRPLSFANNNNLGTFLKLKNEKSNFTYPEIYLPPPLKSPRIFIPSQGTEEQILGNTFYEGTDTFNGSNDGVSQIIPPSPQPEGQDGGNLGGLVGPEVSRRRSSALIEIPDIPAPPPPTTESKKIRSYPENPGIYRYNVEVNVTDVSKVFLLKALKDLQKAKSHFKKLINYILDSTFGYFDSDSRQINTPLAEIPYEGTNVKTFIRENSINPYIKYLLLFRIPLPSVHIGASPIVHLNNIIERMLDSGIPEDLEEIVKTIEMLELNIANTANVYHTVPLDQLNEGVEKNTGLYEKGTYENKFPIISHKHKFNQKYSYGYKNELGYSYLFSSEEDIANEVGIGRTNTEFFRNRLQQEFNKYFYTEEPPLDTTIFDMIGNGPLYQYLTPACIFSPALNKNQKKVTQLLDLDSTLFSTSLDQYGQLFSRLFKAHYATKYLNFVFYNTVNQMSFDTPTRQTYNSLIDVLDEEYACNIDMVVEKQFEIPTPTYFSNEVNPLTGLTEQEENAALAAGASFTNDIPLPQSIMGGEGDQSSVTTTYYDSITQTYTTENKNQDNLKENNLDASFTFPKDEQPPLKLTFGIIGELELDSAIDFHSFQDNPLNNMRSFGELLNVTSQSVLSDINYNNQGLPNRLAHLPHQLKAMLVVAFSNQDIKLNDIFSIKRTKLHDHDSPARFANAISYYDNRDIDGNPPYDMVSDPMQIYAKFLSFWMNYKQLIKIEYFDGFGKTAGPVGPASSEVLINDNRPTLDNWKPLTREVYDQVTNLQEIIEVGSGQVPPHLLCRLSKINPEEYVSRNEDNNTEGNLYGTSPGSDEGNIDITTDLVNLNKCFGTHEILDLPIYHRYFLLGPDVILDPGINVEDAINPDRIR
tara:strand:+ start:37261 stop:41229 length:3969 start_codon:yes stop_codon:yes gene_type:complete